MSDAKQVQLPAVVQEHLKSLEKTRQSILDMVPTVYLAEELIVKFKELPGTKNWRISLGYAVGQLSGVLVFADCLDIRELTVVRRWLREQGFPAARTEDYPEIGRRSWIYKRDDGSTLVFSAFPGGFLNENIAEGQRCQFVKVGMKEPEPLYELRCDGEKLEEENILESHVESGVRERRIYVTPRSKSDSSLSKGGIPRIQ